MRSGKWEVSEKWEFRGAFDIPPVEEWTCWEE